MLSSCIVSVTGHGVVGQVDLCVRGREGIQNALQYRSALSPRIVAGGSPPCRCCSDADCITASLTAASASVSAVEFDCSSPARSLCRFRLFTACNATCRNEQNASIACDPHLSRENVRKMSVLEEEMVRPSFGIFAEIKTGQHY